jgi:hypothetical protein
LAQRCCRRSLEQPRAWCSRLPTLPIPPGRPRRRCGCARNVTLRTPGTLGSSVSSGRQTVVEAREALTVVSECKRARMLTFAAIGYFTNSRRRGATSAARVLCETRPLALEPSRSHRDSCGHCVGTGRGEHSRLRRSQKARAALRDSRARADRRYANGWSLSGGCKNTSRLAQDAAGFLP